jgi:hypothetical protein
VGAEAWEERVNVSGVGNGEGALGGDVVDDVPEELLGHRVCLDVIEGRQGREKEIEVGAIGVFNTKIFDYADEGYPGMGRLK